MSNVEKTVMAGSKNKQNVDLFKKQGRIVCACSSQNPNLSEERDILYLQFSRVSIRKF